MKRDTSYVIKRAEHFKSILTAEGFLVGIVAGLVVLLYNHVCKPCLYLHHCVGNGLKA